MMPLVADKRESLDLSSDRKVAVAVTARKHRVEPTIKNAFGLPAGRPEDGGSCPGATSVCYGVDKPVCYAAQLERSWASPRALVRRNYEALKAAGTVDAMADLLDEMLAEFVDSCERFHKRNPEWSMDELLRFRIHWDGDFFSVDYAKAWAEAMRRHRNVRFWAYTRSFDTVPVLARVPNLSLYLSVDEANASQAYAVHVDFPWVGVATLGDTFGHAEDMMRAMTGRNAPACPELTGRVGLTMKRDGRTVLSVEDKGERGIGACVACKLCPNGTNNVRFAINR